MTQQRYSWATTGMVKDEAGSWVLQGESTGADAPESLEYSQRLECLLMPMVCLCQHPSSEPSEHGEQCPYRILCTRPTG